MREPRFPILLLSRDGGEIGVYDRFEELQDCVEITDVENGEYGGWDSDGLRLRLSATRAAGMSDWLHIQLTPDVAMPKEILDAVLRHAEHISCPLHIQAGESLVDFARRIDEWEIAQKRARRPFWRRLLRFARADKKGV